MHLGKLRLLAMAISTQVLVTQGFAATLDNISHTTLPGNQQQIAFKLSENSVDTQTFQIEDPARIAIDLMGTTNALCLLYTSPSPRDKRQSRMPSSA